MNYFKKALSLILALVITVVLLPGCQEDAAQGPSINNVSLSKYAIVYSDTDTDYALRAAEYIQAQIKEITGLELPLQEDSAVTADYEIVVGNTERKVSEALQVEAKQNQFALMALDNQIALEGDYFLIAAAAYYFVRTYITGTQFQATIPTEPAICTPITQEPNNYILLIGDGMGPNQTKLYEQPPFLMTGSNKGFSDGESIFYGYLLPHQGFARTNSLSGVTDSAASGTALSTGYKTINKYVGLDKDQQPLQSLTELGNELGMATAVLSTEPATGATPAAFSAHASDRSDSKSITISQAVIQQVGTILRCGFDVYTNSSVKKQVETAFQETLTTLSQDPDGFFMMYEEAHIDKHCHSNDLTNAFLALARFNQIIGLAMEYAFYHPDTFVLITADHETGKLLPDSSGRFCYNSTSHSDADVPVFAFGQGSVVFHDVTIENVQIPKTIAKLWGVTDFGDPTNGFPALG